MKDSPLTMLGVSSRLTVLVAVVFSRIGGASVSKSVVDDIADDGVSLLQMYAGTVVGSRRSTLSLGEASLLASNSTGQAPQTNSNYWPDMSNWPESLLFPTFDVTRPIKIVEWTGYKFLSPVAADRTPNCSFEWIFPDDDADRDPDKDISDADVVLFYLPRMVKDKKKYGQLPRKKRPGQIWITMCHEPTERKETGFDCRLLHDDQTMHLMDGHSSYSLDSDFPAVQDPPEEMALRAPVPNFAARVPHALATLTISDCQGDRMAWAASMMREIEKKGDRVLSYGTCLHNAEESPPTDVRINPLSSRLFKLVSENTVEPWYVTEKVWEALMEGSIPVYRGSEEVKRWVPPGSILFASDFHNEEEIADLLLSFTEEDFADARAWKKHPTSLWGGWSEAWELSHYTLLPRICESAAKSLDAFDRRA